MAKRTLAGVEVTADKIVAALIDRLFAVERQLAALQKQVGDNFECYVDSLPQLTPDGKMLRFREVLQADAEGTQEFTVIVRPANVAANEPAGTRG